MFFSEPHPDAVGTRGPEMVEHAEKRRGGPLRWFQWLCAQRRYEIRADGSWCWPLVFESVMRQQGKSVDLTEDAAWIGSLPRDDPAWAAAFDSEDVGLISHAAHRVTLSRAIQAKLWSWAVSQDYDVRQQLGDSRIIWPHGPQWVTVAMESVYGFGPNRALVDEAWSMDPAGFWNAMWPAMSDHPNVQALFFSAANPADRGLVADLRADLDVCRMEWGAHPSEDQDDESVWIAATAYMGPGRLAKIRKGHGRPGFRENWLNVWPEPTDMARWLTKARTDDAARVPVGKAPPQSAVCAVECSLDGQRWAVAAAWQGRGLLRARVWDLPDVTACLRVVGQRAVRMHQATLQRLPMHGRFMAEPVSAAQHRAATGILADLIRRGGLALAGVDDDAWKAVRTSPADGGEQIDARRSTGDVQAVKALAWAVWAVQSGQGQSGLVL